MALNVLVGGKLLHYPVCIQKIWVETVQLLCFAAAGGPKSQLFSNAHCTQMGKQRDLNIEEKTDGVSTKVIGQRLGWSQHSIQRLFLMGKTYRRLIAGRGVY
jgi:hypothetical protein